MENSDVDTPEQEPNIVADVPPVASSKTKKVILVGCGFCVLLFLVCAGIGLPMVAKLRRNVQEFSENVKAEDDARMQRLEEQYEMPEADASLPMEASSDEASGTTEQPTSMTFKKISAGTFMMGSPRGEGYGGADETQHKVTITKAFYIQTTEVTQGQWKAVMSTEPWKGQIFGGKPAAVKEGTNYPATYVNWDDAVAYCKKLSEKEGKTYRLPTEAEWEYACRAGTQTTWSFGNDEQVLGDYAWYRENAYAIGAEFAHQGRLKRPNAFGLFDMHGNVYEWCHDYYKVDYYNESPVVDPQGPPSGSPRVLRGGSWILITRDTRSAVRFRYGQQAGSRLSGFRVVRELD